MEIEISDFTGCKIALFCGDKLLTILRDDKSNIPYPNTWELPGGGRRVMKVLLSARRVKLRRTEFIIEDCLLYRCTQVCFWGEGIHLSSWQVKGGNSLIVSSLVMKDSLNWWVLRFLSSDKVVPSCRAEWGIIWRVTMIRLERAGAEV